MTRNFAKSGADPAGGGYLENTWKNIPKYVAPKEIEKTTGDNIFPWRNLLKKSGNFMRYVLLFLK